MMSVCLKTLFPLLSDEKWQSVLSEELYHRLCPESLKMVVMEAGEDFAGAIRQPISSVYCNVRVFIFNTPPPAFPIHKVSLSSIQKADVAGLTPFKGMSNFSVLLLTPTT